MNPSDESPVAARTTALCRASLLAAAVLVLSPARAQNVTNTYTLRAGWNALWLDVQPVDPKTEVVLGGLPLAGIWTYRTAVTTAEFIQNDSEPAVDGANWLRWLPPAGDRPPFLNDLSVIQANHPYLVKLTNDAAFTVVGRPALRSLPWTPKAYTLRGFPIDPQGPPTFGAFFAPSKEHAGQPVYRLDNATGKWVLAAAADPMRDGEAYWVFCNGASTYPGPMEVTVDLGDGLDFGITGQDLSLKLRNYRAADGNALVRDAIHAAGTSVYYRDPAAPGTAYVRLENPHAVALPPGAGGIPGVGQSLQLGVRRTEIKSTNGYTGVIEVADGLGTRYRVPLRADANPPAYGLWMGTAKITAVSEAHSGSPSTPTPVKSPFELRLLLHFGTNDAGGPRVALLKEVVEMWKPAVSTGTGNDAITVPGHAVLLTRDELIPNYTGASQRGGVGVGRRLSSVGFAFDGGTNHFLELSGNFAPDGHLAGVIAMGPDHPTNPFRHKFHPDHDNLDADFAPLQSGTPEVFAVRRELAFDFIATDPDTGSPPGTTLKSLDYGVNGLSGTYTETATGLHRNPIVATGTFTLRRVSLRPVLNQ